MDQEIEILLNQKAYPVFYLKPLCAVYDSLPSIPLITYCVVKQGFTNSTRHSLYFISMKQNLNWRNPIRVRIPFYPSDPISGILYQIRLIFVQLEPKRNTKIGLNHHQPSATFTPLLGKIKYKIIQGVMVGRSPFLGHPITTYSNLHGQEFDIETFLDG